MINSSLLHELANGLSVRDEKALLRTRKVMQSAQNAHVIVDGCEYLNFCSNDYLGLANHPDLRAAAISAVNEYGVGSGASHLICGHQLPHQILDEQIAAFMNLPAALSFSTGYMANVGAIPALVGRGDAIFADRLNHASLNDACILSRADFKRFQHNDMAHLSTLLSASSAHRKMIVVDAVFSMDGDVAPVAELLRLAEEYDAWLYIDDAHGFGVLGEGRGTLASLNITSPRIIYMATLGKAAGSNGAFIAGEQVLIDWLINNAHTAIYTTAMPAAIAAATMAALPLIRQDSWRRQKLQNHIELLKNALAKTPLQLAPSSTAIQPILLESSDQALQMSHVLWDQGIWVAAIRPPTVKQARLRITLSAAHGDEDVNRLINALRALV